MRYSKIFFLIRLATLLTSVNILAEVYDDAGEIIAEEEIRAEMGSAGRKGCLLSGGLLSFGASLLGSCILGAKIHNAVDNESVIAPILILGTVVGTILGSKLSYEAGEAIDRQSAIKRIRIKRREQQQSASNLWNRRLFLARSRFQFPRHRDGIGVTLPLLAVRF